MAAAVLIASHTHAGPRDQVKRIHDRVVGVPPSQAFLDAWASEVGTRPADVAWAAMQEPGFYDVTLKNLAKPWTNRDRSVFVPLNDYVATFVGMVRDGVDIRQILYGDVLYVADPALGLPAYSTSNNQHYEALENSGASMQSALVARQQSAVTGLPAAATAGLTTTRAAAKAFFIAGTNRAMFRYTLLNQLCTDLEQLQDTSLPADRIRQDISRSPGGDSRIFLNNCISCHNGMDPLAQAYAYYNYSYDVNADPDGNNGQITYNSAGAKDPVTGSRVVAKYHINSTNFEPGYVTPDDQWDNYWRKGINSLLGWDSALPGSGSGAKSMGRELAHSDAFATCQVTKVFQAVCLRPPSDGADRAQVASMVSNFASQNYDLRQPFADAAVYCMGD
ncbi:MAG TPA: hypothetical protein VL027_04240 [Spongiibacteraceae bacterium]|nr:hypothetical protein [Spongiibacteraceae bacterium]